MLSISLLRDAKITRADFTKFVKSKSIHSGYPHYKNHAVATKLAEYAHSAAANSEDDDEDNWDDFGTWSEEAATCCGVGELGGLEGLSDKKIKGTIAHALAKGWRFLIYYSISPESANQLKELGFEQVGEFVNRNTGNRIRVLVLQVG